MDRSTRSKPFSRSSPPFILSRPPALVICVLALPARHTLPSRPAPRSGVPGGMTAPDKPSPCRSGPRRAYGPGGRTVVKVRVGPRLLELVKSESQKHSRQGPPSAGRGPRPLQISPHRPKRSPTLEVKQDQNNNPYCRAIGAPVGPGVGARRQDGQLPSC